MQQLDPEATESSSCDSSESDEEPATADEVRSARRKYKRRKVQCQWDAERTGIGWRWSWLELMLSQKDSLIEQHDQLLNRARARKPPCEFTEQSTDGEPSCARARPLKCPQPTGQPRELPPKVFGHMRQPVSGGRLEPTGWSHNTIRSFSLRLDPTFHATLSLPTDGNAVVLGKVRAWRRSKLSQLRG